MIATHRFIERCPSEPVTAVPSSLPSKLGPLPLTMPRVARLSEGHLSLSQLAAAFATPPRPAALLAVLLAVACSGPVSYEEFVRAEDVADGVYEFALPGGAPSSPVTFDLSFYTAPLKEPLQLEITLDSLKETVWFPAGQNKALYRSGLSFTGLISDLSKKSPKSLQVPPKMPLPVEKSAEISTGTPEITPTCRENGDFLYRSRSGGSCTEEELQVLLKVRPLNPPEDFRGLGIIIKRNDGTR